MNAPRKRGKENPRRWLAALLPALLVALPFAAAQARVEVPRIHTKKPAPGTPIDVLAQRIIFDAKRNVATAVGKVRIVYGPYTLHASKVIYDRARDQLYAHGEVVLEEPNGNVLLADYVNVDEKFRNGFARHLRLLLTNDATLKARYARRRDGYLTTYTNVSYTRCSVCVLDDGTPTWELKSEEAVHDERKGRIFHRNMTMEMWGVPVFWLPYFSHPDPKHKRATGFLTPRAGYKKDLGVYASIPYFINLAPNYDITLIPTAYSKTGVYAQALWRHRVASGTYSISAGGIRQFNHRKIDPPGDRKWRGHVWAKGDFRLNSRWKWGFDGALASDRTVMQRYDVRDGTDWESRIWLAGLDGRNYFIGELSHYRMKSSLMGAETALPDVHFYHTFQQDILGGELTYASHVYSLRRDGGNTPFSGVNQAKSQSRMISELIWRRRMVSSAGIVAQPFARMRMDVYHNRHLPDPSVPGGVRDPQTVLRLLPTAGIDLRWPFLSTGALGRHVVTPVFQFIAARDETRRDEIGNEDAISLNFSAHNLFLHNRFSGHDRFEGGVRANAGLLYGLYLPSGGFLRASVGQSLHLSGRNSFGRAAGSGLADDISDLVAAVDFAPNEHFRMSWTGRFDVSEGELKAHEAHAGLSWNGISGSVLYTDLAADPEHGRTSRSEQIAAAAAWNFRGNWTLFGDWRYDLASSRSVKRGIGIGYDCDCLNVRLKYEQNFTSDADAISSHKISLSVIFKTLGGSVSKPEKPF